MQAHFYHYFVTHWIGWRCDADERTLIKNDIGSGDGLVPSGTKQFRSLLLPRSWHFSIMDMASISPIELKPN